MVSNLEALRSIQKTQRSSPRKESVTKDWYFKRILFKIYWNTENDL